MNALPSGTVTYLMTDVVGSTQLWERDARRMSDALARHDAIAEACAQRHQGHIVKERGEGDSLFIVFARPGDALACALDFQLCLIEEGLELSVRSAIHTGASEIRNDDYYGPSVNRCARLRAIAHGGQIVISGASQTLLADSLPAEMELHDLGLHRLKDLMRPERVWEALHPRLPRIEAPLTSLDRLQHNLPVQLTSFVGRREDMAQLLPLLREERLVTLMGSGGCGKTRLALQLASELCEEFPQGAWFIDFSPTPSTESPAAQVIKSLHLQDVAGAPPEQTVVEAFAASRALLILDNCEHLVDAIAELVQTLLSRCPKLHILATSRESLRVPGEARWRVPSLSVPTVDDSPEEMLESDAVRLFIDRASARDRTFKLSPSQTRHLAELCRLLDGIPLAVEQAASHAQALSSEQMVARFSRKLRSLATNDRGVTNRHRTLRATIEWSYDMLSPEERAMLHRCTVFVGGFTLEAAEAVCPGDGIEPDEIGDLTQSLLEKSLIFTEESSDAPRYRMLQSIRDFALENCPDVERLRERHAGYFLAWARTHAAKDDFPHVDLEFENVASAISWSLAPAPSEAFSCLIGLRMFFLRYGRLHRGITLFRECLQAEADPATAAQMSNILGAMCTRAGHLELAKTSFEESLIHWANVGNQSQQAAVLTNLGLATALMRDLPSARTLLQKSVELYRTIGDRRGEGHSLMNLGRLKIDLGEIDDSLEDTTAAVQVLGEIEDFSRIATGYANLAVARHLSGDDVQSLRDLRTACQFLSGQPDASALSLVLCLQASIARRYGQAGEAEGLAAAARSLTKSLGHSFTDLEERLLAGVTVRASGKPQSLAQLTNLAVSRLDVLTSYLQQV